MKVQIKDAVFLSYLAGVIDSDGAIGISRRNNVNNSKGYTYREIVQITWKKSEDTLAFVELLKNIYGGYVGEHKGGFNKQTTTVRYSADGKRAGIIVKDILPYLILKKRQAELVLEMRCIKGVRYGNGNRKPDSIWEQESDIYEKAILQRRSIRL